MKKSVLAALAALVAMMVVAPGGARACTRCVYVGPDGGVLVARSFDWMEDAGTDLYCLPRGMEREGAAGGSR